MNKRRAKSAKHLAYLKRLGAHIAKVRIEQGYSKDRVGLEAGFSSATMGRIERGQAEAKIYTLKTIADVLGVTVGRLTDIK